jgi:hypothetical protein
MMTLMPTTTPFPLLPTGPEPDFLPRFVRRETAAWRQLFGFETHIEQLDVNTWRALIANSRVWTTVTFKRDRSNGKVSWGSSVLVIDGRERPLAADIEAFAALFNDPDSITPYVVPLPASTTNDDTPAAVAAAFILMEKVLPGKSTFGIAKTGEEWVVGADSNGATRTATLRLTFSHIGGLWKIRARTGIQIVVDGVDHSHQAAGDVARAVAIATDLITGPKEPVDTPVRKAAGAQRTNSVEIRRATVIRN